MGKSKVSRSGKGLSKIEESDLSNALKELDLSKNKIAEIPSSIANAPNLQILTMNLNSLTSISNDIGNLACLTTLKLEGNQLESLPGAIGGLQCLKKLFLKGNRLKALPEEMGELKALELLDIQSNSIKALPCSMKDCISLKKFELRANPLLQPPLWVCAKGVPAIRQYLVRKERILSDPSSFTIFNFEMKNPGSDEMPPMKRKGSPPYYISVSESLKGVKLSCKADVCVYETEGGRDYMEDRHVVTIGDDFCPSSGLRHACERAYFGVYDGHGGSAAADWVKDNLHKNLVAEQAFIDATGATDKTSLFAALKGAYMKTDKDFLVWAKKNSQNNSGTTVNSILMFDNSLSCLASPCAHFSSLFHLDSTLSRCGLGLRLSVDHKPEIPEEKERIEKLGGFVSKAGASGPQNRSPWRVMGELAVARCIGDFELKKPQPFVTADPYVFTTSLSPNDHFVILASDGLWDVINDQKACDMVMKCATLEEAPKVLSDAAIKAGSQDNITIAVIYFHWSADE